MKDSSRIQMKIISPKIQVMLTGIKSIYLNPYHYTYVIQKEDNYIYLYDQMTMDMVGRSTVPFSQAFKTFMFTDNFNVFWTYIENKQNINQHSQIIKFQLGSDGVIGHYRQPLTRNGAPQNLTLTNIDYYESILEQKSFIVGVSSNKIHYINFEGQITKQIDIISGGRQLNLINSFVIKQKKWIFIEQSKIYFVNITDGYKIQDSLEINVKISSIFRGSFKGKFMAFITSQHVVFILSQKNNKWQIRYRLKILNLNIKKLSFFYPGVNTSTTNKFKDKLFLLIYGSPNIVSQEKNSYFNEYQEDKKVHKSSIPNELLKDQNLYVHQYSIEELNGLVKPDKSFLKNCFCLRDIGVIKYSIWANEHSQNCIRIFKDDQSIISIDLIPLLQECFAGRQWVCLGYRFEAKAANVLYQQTEDNFEHQHIVVKTVYLEELNDWSYSMFSKETLLNKKVKRLNCLQF